MRLSQVCIERPVLATVMSLVILLFGGIAASRLPNRELPDVDPPVVSVTTVYPGAAPEVVETSVTQPLEDQLIGIEGVKHVTSTSREQVSQISVEFGLQEDLEAAANDVRDRVSRARRDLPDEVDEPLVAKRDADARPIIWIALSGERYDQIQLTRIAETQIKDRLGKLDGVSNVLIAGERRYAMRVWIDNSRLTARGLTVADVSAALARENVDIPSGRVESTDQEFTVRSLGELRTAEEYGKLVVASRSGELVRLRDVADVEAGPEDERKVVRFNGAPGLGLGVVKQSKANTLDVAARVRATVSELDPVLPPGVKLEVAYDSSVFVSESIDRVRRTIYEAVFLVVLVIYCFLRSARATLIPAVAIPVSVLGAFTILYAFGFSINTLTMMGFTLAIGLVVDDAIVVVENIARWMEQGTPPLEAAKRGMNEISFAVISATISAVAVFIPLMFLTDTTGRLFREFAVTVGAAVAISGFVALTLSPALCALVIRKGRGEESALKRFLTGVFDAPGRFYVRILRPALARPWVWVGVGIVWVLFGALLYQQIDQELIPNSDRGSVVAFTRAPEGMTIEYTDRYQRQTERIFLTTPEVQRVFSVVALGIGTPGLVNEGALFSMLYPKGERERSQYEVVSDINDRLSDIPGIEAFAINPRPLGQFAAAPVSLVIQGSDIDELARIADEVVQEAKQVGGYKNLQTDLYLNKPQLEVEIDRDRASDLGVSVRDVATALQILLGGLDISSFKLEGETYNVVAQLRREDRSNPQDLLGLYVRGRDSGLVPLASVVNARETIAPRALPHFDRFRAVTITARLGPELAQQQALEQVYRMAMDAVPPGQGYNVTFSGDAEKFLEASNALLFAYVFALLVVYLVLAAQFESFVHPLTILVAVALSFTGALVALELVNLGRDFNLLTLNIYSKIGLVMLVGLVTKNSILIVEFCNQLRERGRPLREATFEACRIRFRPILMTALATIAGLTPIALGAGAGGESRQPLGVAVVGGVFFATFLSFFVVPAVYLTIEGLRARRTSTSPVAVGSTPQAAEPGRG